jgi:hypothetical protein
MGRSERWWEKKTMAMAIVRIRPAPCSYLPPR